MCRKGTDIVLSLSGSNKIQMEYLTSFPDYYSSHLLGEKEVLRLGIDIAAALVDCERLDIIHRDIKPENIFVSRYGNFKLGDFGISRTLDRTIGTYTQGGTRMYEASEILENEKYGPSVDRVSACIV